MDEKIFWKRAIRWYQDQVGVVLLKNICSQITVFEIPVYTNNTHKLLLVNK